MEKYGSIRIQKAQLTKGLIRGNRYYKSYKQQMEHDFRLEEMESNYLKRPNEKNKYHEFIKKDLMNITNQWEDIREDFKKANNKKLHRQTKPTINGIITFSKDFDLDETERQRQFDIIKGWIAQEFDFPIYVVQHNDEKALHYHFSILNYDNESKRPLSKQINTSKLQDKVFNYLKEKNVDYGHNRGISKTISLKEHKTIMEGKLKEKEEQIEVLEKKINNLHQDKINLKEQIEELSEDRAEFIIELEEILIDFIDLGLSYKNKSNTELVGMFKRYLSGEQLEKAKRLRDKLEKQVDKHKKKAKKTTNNNNHSPEY